MKKGIQGIFKRTNVPKFEIETPTESAKNKEKIKENRANGWARISVKNLYTLSFISR